MLRERPAILNPQKCIIDKKDSSKCKTFARTNILQCLSAEAFKSKDTVSLHPSVDMLTKPSFIADSQPGKHSPSVTLIRRLVRNKLASPISPQTYIHLVLQIYTSSYPGMKIQHDMRVYSAPLERRLISLSFMKKPQSYSDQHVSYDAAAAAIN